MKMKTLHNKYFLMRHGESKANVAGIILSHLENGVQEEFTLTQKSEEQVMESVKSAKTEGWLEENVIIYSSPFSRCKKTAEIAKEVLGVKDGIIIDERLKERHFGDFEKTHNSNYQKVWEADIENPGHKNDNVESAQEVQQRTLSLIDDLEKKYANKKVLLVSHGDALQILQTGMLQKSPAVHRQLEHINTAQIIELKL